MHIFDRAMRLIRLIRTRYRMGVWLRSYAAEILCGPGPIKLVLASSDDSLSANVGANQCKGYVEAASSKW